MNGRTYAFAVQVRALLPDNHQEGRVRGCLTIRNRRWAISLLLNVGIICCVALSPQAYASKYLGGGTAKVGGGALRVDDTRASLAHPHDACLLSSLPRPHCRTSPISVLRVSGP